MPYWKATVEKPDGEGGWQLVAVFGTESSAATGTGRHLHADTPQAAVKLLLSNVWPINLSEPGRYEKPRRWSIDKERSTGIADHRITVEVDDRKWNLRSGAKPPAPVTFTVAELRLADVRQMVTESVAASIKAAELTAQARTARSDASHARWRIEQAVEEAARAGVDPTELAKAKRVPRPRRPKKS